MFMGVYACLCVSMSMGVYVCLCLWVSMCAYVCLCMSMSIACLRACVFKLLISKLMNNFTYYLLFAASLIISGVIHPLVLYNLPIKKVGDYPIPLPTQQLS